MARFENSMFLSLFVKLFCLARNRLNPNFGKHKFENSEQKVFVDQVDFYIDKSCQNSLKLNNRNEVFKGAYKEKNLFEKSAIDKALHNSVMNFVG